MNIRRFVSPDMREALNAIRADLGADAVMLSSRKIAEGVEVIAAIDYDDSLLSIAGGRDAVGPDVFESPAGSLGAADDEPPEPAQVSGAEPVPNPAVPRDAQGRAVQ